MAVSRGSRPPALPAARGSYQQGARGGDRGLCYALRVVDYEAEVAAEIRAGTLPGRVRSLVDALTLLASRLE